MISIEYLIVFAASLAAFVALANVVEPPLLQYRTDLAAEAQEARDLIITLEGMCQ